jgi:hypothetical protein
MFRIKFKYVVLASAFFIASCAALFSVTGISQLFVGATLAAGVMAASLEVGKLVSISFLFRFWKLIPKTFKVYMTIGAFVLMLITSLGIYGYLSSAYASAASGVNARENQITLYDAELQNAAQSITAANTRIANLQTLRAQQENRLDTLIARNRLTGTQQSIIRQTTTDMRTAQNDLSKLMQRRDSLELLKTNTSNGIQTEGKIGTFYYVAKTLGISLDSVVKWFILIIIFVFDPLSISLVVAYNLIIKTENLSQSIDSPRQEAVVLPPIAPTATPEPPQVADVSSRPYFTDPNYDWENDTRWHTDPRAQVWYSNLGINPSQQRKTT